MHLLPDLALVERLRVTIAMVGVPIRNQGLG